MNTNTPTPRTLELCNGGATFYLRDERGSYIAKTCGDSDQDMAYADAIAHRYNAYDQLRADLARADHWRDELQGLGGTPELVESFIKGQQDRIYAAQNLEEQLTRVTAERDELK